MISISTNLIFILLNSAVYIGIALWVIRTQVMPLVRASFATHIETAQQLTDEVIARRAELVTVEERYVMQEREIARLTAATERWAGMLLQRAAASEQEARELAFRYKNSCAEIARARVAQVMNRAVSKQALKDARAALVRIYADSEKQQRYTDAVCRQLVRKDLRNGGN